MVESIDGNQAIFDGSLEREFEVGDLVRGLIWVSSDLTKSFYETFGLFESVGLMSNEKLGVGFVFKLLDEVFI